MPDPTDSPVDLRFESTHRPLRARGARPLLWLGTTVASATARFGSREALHRVERAWGRVAEVYLDLSIDAEGVELVDPDRRYLLLALHEGLADPLALLRLPLGLSFLVRDELFDWPALGGYLVAAGHVRVDRQPSRAALRRTIEQAEAVVGRGDSLVVFAQASILGIEVAFEGGAVSLARRLRVQLLPVVLSGSHRVWEHPYSPTLRFGQRLFMRVMNPVAVGDLTPERLRTLEREMKAVAIQEAPVAPRRFVPERDGWWDDYHYRIDPDFPQLAARVERHRRSLMRSG